jgi:hypothetical protein
VLADAFKGGVATTADSKGLLLKDHPQVIGEWIRVLDLTAATTSACPLLLLLLPGNELNMFAGMAAEPLKVWVRNHELAVGCTCHAAALSSYHCF